MRWFVYCGMFITILFCSFWSYVWIFRVDFIQTALERSCPPYKISIEAVEFQDFETVSISNLSLLTREDFPKVIAHISKATFSSSPQSWLYWLFTPSTNPLSLKKSTFVTSQSNALAIDQPAINIFLDIDTLTIEDPKAHTRTLQSFHGRISDLLKAATEP